jgi:hypothetical protein
LWYQQTGRYMGSHIVSYQRQILHGIHDKVDIRPSCAGVAPCHVGVLPWFEDMVCSYLGWCVGNRSFIVPRPSFSEGLFESHGSKQ